MFGRGDPHHRPRRPGLHPLTRAAGLVSAGLLLAGLFSVGWLALRAAGAPARSSARRAPPPNPTGRASSTHERRASKPAPAVLAPPQRPSRSASARLASTAAQRALPYPLRLADAPKLTSPPGTVSALESYLSRTIYPPSSQPLDPARHLDLLKPNRRGESEQRVPEDARLRFYYSANVYWVLGAGEVVSFLRVTRVDPGGRQAPAPVEVVEAVAELVDRAKRLPITYRRKGDRYEHRFVPLRAFGAIDGSARLRLRLRFAFRDAEGEPHERSASLAFVFRARPVGAFTGRFAERASAEGLRIEAEVRVEKPGLYTFDANLFDRDDSPVAYARHKAQLGAGHAWVPFGFFGGVLAHSRARPPFKLRQLRGVLYDPQARPPQAPLAPYRGAYVTEDYALTSFSSEEWQGAARRAQAERLLRDQALGRYPPPVPVEAHRASLPRFADGHLPPPLERWQ